MNWGAAALSALLSLLFRQASSIQVCSLIESAIDETYVFGDSTVHVHPMPGTADEVPLVRWMETLHSASHECEWILLAPANAYFNYRALTQRLDCGFAIDHEPLAFARMSGRLSRLFVYIEKQAVFFGIVRTGLLVNRAVVSALKKSYQHGLSKSSVEQQYVTDAILLDTIGKVETIDNVHFDVNDISISLFLYRTLKLRVSNWASYLDHYVLGSLETVLAKAMLRSQVSSAPCVLAAHPVNFTIMNFLEKHSATCCADPDCDVHDMSETQYSWQNQGNDTYSTQNYYRDTVNHVLSECRLVNALPTPPTIQIETPIPRVSGHVILSPPGGGTTWFFSLLKKHTIDSETMATEDIFHPYVNEVFRAELSYCFAAAEDNTRKNLMLKSCPHSDVLPRLVKTVTLGKPFMTKEVINIFRVLEMSETLNVQILLLYRSRFSTFPTVGDDTCRMCFYNAFHHSLLALNHNEPWLDHAKQYIGAFPGDSAESAVLIHTVLWRYMLFRIPNHSRRVVNYDDLLKLGSHLELKSMLSQNWGLSKVVDLDDLTAEILSSRQSYAWILNRHVEYKKLAVEQHVLKLLRELAAIDPYTDTTLLN